MYILLISLFIDLVSYLFMYVFIYIVNMSNVPKTSPDSEKITPSQVVGNSIAVTVASQLLRAPAPRRGSPGLKNGGVCRHLMGIYRGYNGD